MTETPQPSRRRRIAGERRPAGPRASSRPAPAEAAFSAPPVTEESDLRAEPTAPEPREPSDRRVVSPFLAVGMAIVAVILVGLAAGYGVPRYLDVRSHNTEETAGQAAQAAAERASIAIMSYGYKTLDSDEKAAMKFMTADMAKRYQETFDASVKPNAPALKANVTATLLASGVVHASGDRVDVLLYVNQTTISTANGGDPQVAENRVVFRMVKVDGSWLVDEITPK